MQKYKKFFDYLFETVELNPVIPKGETMLPFSPKDEKLFKPRNIKEEPLMSRHYQSLSGRENKKENFRQLSKQRNLLKKQIKEYEVSKRDQKEFLLQPVTMIKNDQEWLEKIEDLKIIESEMQTEKSSYQKNLDYLIKKFFSIGGKMPRRYLYLPLSSSNTINVQQIEKLNYASPIDVFRKVRGGNFLIVDQSHNEIIDYLKRHGYRCDEGSYIKNECVNENGKTIPIDMELKRISEIDINNKLAFISKMKSKPKLNSNEEKAIKSSEMDIEKRREYKDYYVYKVLDNKENINLFLNHVIVLTWVPRLIMSQSSNTVWKSCMRYFLGDMTNRDSGQEGDEEDEEVGGNVHFVPSGIRGGTFIAWLVDLDDKKIRMPKARILMKPYDTTDGKIFYWPSTVYSTGGQKNIIDIFAKTMKLYAISKQKGILNKENRHDISIGMGIYHDNDDISSTSDLMSQAELIRKMTSGEDSHFAVNDLNNLFDTADYSARGIEVFIKNKKVKEKLLNDVSSDMVFYKLFRGMIEKKEFRLINTLLSFYKRENAIGVFFNKLSYYITKTLESTSEMTTLNKNILVYLYKSLIIPNANVISEIDLMSVKFIVNRLRQNKIEEIYGKTAIDDMIDIVPTFFDKLNRTEFDRLFFLLKPKTLEKVLIRNPKYREMDFDFYLPELFRENKEKFYFFINNFKVSVDANSDEEYANMMMQTMIDIFKETISDISYKDLIDFIQSKYFNFSEDMQEEIDFNINKYPYITIISRFNEKECDNIFKICKSRGLDIEKIYETSKIDRKTIELLYSAFQNKTSYTEKELIRCLNYIRTKPKEFTDFDFLNNFRWQLENKKEINYDFLNKIAEVLSEINKFSDKAAECTTFFDNIILYLCAKDPNAIKEKNKIKKIIGHFMKSPNFWSYVLKTPSEGTQRNIPKMTMLYLFPQEYKEASKNISFYGLIDFHFSRTSLMESFDLINLIIKNKINVIIDRIEPIDDAAFEGEFILSTFKKLYENRLITNMASAEAAYYDLKLLIPTLFVQKIYDKKETHAIIEFYKELLKKVTNKKKTEDFMRAIVRSVLYSKTDHFKDLYFDFFDKEEQMAFIKYFFEKELTGRVNYSIKDIDMVIETAFAVKDLDFTKEKLEKFIVNAIDKKTEKVSLIINLLQSEHTREITKKFLEEQKLSFFDKYENLDPWREEHLTIILKALSLQKLKEIINADPIKYRTVSSVLARLSKQIIEGIK